MNTIERYSLESETELGWKNRLGKALAFSGLVIFANAFLVSLLFRHLLSLRDEIILIAVGGVIAIAGLRLRKSDEDQMSFAVEATVAAIFVTLLKEAVHYLGLIGFVLIVVLALLSLRIKE